MDRHIGSGAEYAKLIIDEIKSMDEPNQNIKDVWPYWFELIKERANLNWILYIRGNRQTYMFGNDEIQELWKKASMDHLQTLINGMVDKGVLEAGIDENGDVVYNVTEEGKNSIL